MAHNIYTSQGAPQSPYQSAQPAGTQTTPILSRLRLPEHSAPLYGRQVLPQQTQLPQFHQYLPQLPQLQPSQWQQQQWQQQFGMLVDQQKKQLQKVTQSLDENYRQTEHLQKLELQKLSTTKQEQVSEEIKWATESQKSSLPHNPLISQKSNELIKLLERIYIKQEQLLLANYKQHLDLLKQQRAQCIQLFDEHHKQQQECFQMGGNIQMLQAQHHQQQEQQREFFAKEQGDLSEKQDYQYRCFIQEAGERKNVTSYKGQETFFPSLSHISEKSSEEQIALFKEIQFLLFKERTGFGFEAEGLSASSVKGFNFLNDIEKITVFKGYEELTMPELAWLMSKGADPLNDKSWINLKALSVHDYSFGEFSDYPAREFIPWVVAHLKDGCNRFNITKVSLIGQLPDFFETIMESCPNLKKIYLSNNDKVTDGSISSIVKRCSHLESLTLSSCHSVTDKMFKILASHSRSQEQCLLKKVIILGCNQISVENFDLFKEMLMKKNAETFLLYCGDAHATPESDADSVTSKSSVEELDVTACTDSLPKI